MAEHDYFGHPEFAAYTAASTRLAAVRQQVRREEEVLSRCGIPQRRMEKASRRLARLHAEMKALIPLAGMEAVALWAKRWQDATA